MHLDPQRCYQAVLSHDRRFDGRFFAGVVTTGVYCRPICPVAPPKFENVRWFACAAAAEEAGFRPCKRCRPETAPGTPAWLGTSAVVSRALRLIGEGALDEGSVDQLADRLGLGERQLRRLFAEHLGAAPGAVARVRRVHFARRLIDETELPFAAIAFAAGFASVRQFNHAVRQTFRAAPRALRHARTRKARVGNDGELTVRLPYRPPLDWTALLGFFAARATPGVEAVAGGTYRRTVRIDDRVGIVEIRPGPENGPPCLLMTLRGGGSEHLLTLVERARRFFDLGADPLQIAAHLRRCPTLRARVRAQPGLRVPGAWDPFELAVRAILGQQVTVRGATTLAGRLATAFGQRIDDDSGALTHLFPTAPVLAAADIGRIGLPRARAAAIRALAAAVCGGELTLDTAHGLEDTVARLCTLPGIGPWTAHYIAMRALGEPDAFPAGDLGVRRALGNGGPLPAVPAVERLAERWRPWRAYAVMHLWNGSNPTNSEER
jgi:AraC family transcriptional regulator of adaptative response / DNA-3-methyladenine glycosylase II